MAHWTPRNKKTGVEYDPVDDATRALMESDPMTKGKYTFRQTAQAAKEIKNFGHSEIAVAKKGKIQPVGVEPPKEHTEKELPQA